MSDDGTEKIINPKCVHCKVSDDGTEKIIEPNVSTVRCHSTHERDHFASKTEGHERERIARFFCPMPILAAKKALHRPAVRGYFLISNWNFFEEKKKK